MRIEVTGEAIRILAQHRFAVRLHVACRALRDHAVLSMTERTIHLTVLAGRAFPLVID